MVRLIRALATVTLLGCSAADSTSIPAPAATGRGPAAGPLPAEASAPPPVEDAGDAATTPGGPATLAANRDRLIDTLAARKATTRCTIWKQLTATQQGVFLTITDLLGKRSFMTADPPAGAARSGAELEMALDHVTKLYELRDAGIGNGGGDNNRIWLQVDAPLATALRVDQAGLPEWAPSTDLAGPHAPFDATSETIHGQPRGQAHFWSADAKSKTLARPGVEGIDDPHIVEIDIDYDIFHNSNPEGTYFPGGVGRDAYTKFWTPRGAGGPELDYVPTGCTK